MQALKETLKYIDFFIDWTGKVLCWILVVLMGLAVYEVFTRRFLGAPTIWTFEVSGFGLAAVTMLAMGYTQLHKGHVNIDFLYERFSPRTRALIDIITFLPFIGLFCYVFITVGWEFAAKSWVLHEKTATAFHPPIYPIKSIIPLGAFFLALVAISQLIRNIYFFVKGEEL